MTKKVKEGTKDKNNKDFVNKTKPKNSNLEKKGSFVNVESEKSKDEQPSWIHYLIIIGIILGVLFSIAFIFEIIDRNSDPDEDLVADVNDTYIYKYQSGNVTYNIELNAPLRDIEKFNFTIEPTKYDVLNTINFRFSFDVYNGSDNGQVSMSAIKLRRFLSRVYNFNFNGNESFTTLDTITCENSTINKRVVTFNPYANDSGVFSDDNGCLMVNSTQPNLMPFVIDSFIISVLEE